MSLTPFSFHFLLKFLLARKRLRLPSKIPQNVSYVIARGVDAFRNINLGLVTQGLMRRLDCNKQIGA